MLFCDLVGSTARAERMDPEDVRALLSRYHERVRCELERFGGTVEKFIGDAVMALFGAPTAHEDDPERAVRAALAIREWTGEEGEVQVRIGITTGETLDRSRRSAGRGRGHGVGRRRQHGRASSVRRSRQRHPRRRDDVPGDRSGDRLRRAARSRRQGQVGSGLRAGSPPGAVARARGAGRRGAARRSGEGARRPRCRAPARARGPRGAARHPRRRAGDRQEPARLRALQGDRDRRRADLTGDRGAPCPTGRASASGRSARS